MEATRTTLALPLVPVLLLLGPATLHAQSGPEASPGGFWGWALAETGADGATVVDAPEKDADRSGPWVRMRPDGSLHIHPEDADWRADGRLGASDLRALLGADLLARLLERTGHDREAAPYLNGRWLREAVPPRARVLQVRVVDRPLAEVNDLDGDGRVDALLVRRTGG